MKTLSIIVPAYNSEHFLHRAIPSFLHPDVLDELDIIIVDDGSTDGTAAAAKTYCAEHPQSIRLISQENKGHGGALNTGCAAAVGKYLKVIDADDWIRTENLPEFVRILRHCDSDVVLTHHCTVDISTGETKKWMCNPPEFGKNYTFEQIMAQRKNFDCSLTFHGITYRTEFYQRNAINLSEHVFYEDHEYATIPCCYASSVMPLDLFIYNYRIGDVQQSVSDENQLKRISHLQTVWARLVKEYACLRLDEDDAGCVYYMMKARGVLLSYLTTALLVEPDRKRGREMAQRIMKDCESRFPEVFRLAVKEYRVFSCMNLLGFTGRGWERIKRSRLYQLLKRR